MALFLSKISPLYGERHYIKSGLYLNYVELISNKARHHLEAKWQSAWEYRYTKDIQILLNTTWDLDQIGEDFPFHKRKFSPWGGGDLQFIASF